MKNSHSETSPREKQLPTNTSPVKLSKSQESAKMDLSLHKGFSKKAFVQIPSRSISGFIPQISNSLTDSSEELTSTSNLNNNDNVGASTSVPCLITPSVGSPSPRVKISIEQKTKKLPPPPTPKRPEDMLERAEKIRSRTLNSPRKFFSSSTSDIHNKSGDLNLLVDRKGSGISNSANMGHTKRNRIFENVINSTSSPIVNQKVVENSYNYKKEDSDDVSDEN